MYKNHYTLNLVSTQYLTSMSSMEDSQCYTPQQDLALQDVQNNQIYKKRVQKVGKNSVQGKWTEEENLIYIVYMDIYYVTFASKEKRKSTRIFKSLSDFLTTRTPRQCRSHFQKIMNKFKKLKKVRQFYQEQIGIDEYQKKYEQVSEKLKGKPVKLEEIEHKSITVSIQTEPFQVGLSDLSHVDLMRLISLLNDYQKTQLPFFSQLQKKFFPCEQLK